MNSGIQSSDMMNKDDTVDSVYVDGDRREMPSAERTGGNFQLSDDDDCRDSREGGSEVQVPAALAGKYAVLQRIGSGSQGEIFKARDLKTGDLVAIKVLRIDQVENWKAYDLFEREAKVLSQLDIPGVAKFYEAQSCLEEDPPYAYIVQELIDGVSLESHIRSGRRWTLARTFDIAVQILDILEKLHHSDPPVIHRDLKPSNIMICQRDGKDRVYLIDFGAVANPIVQGGGSTVAGTFGYMPPEQLMGKPGPASDIYSLAATIVYMLSGVSPADIQTIEFRLVIEPHLQAFPATVMHVLGRMLEPSAKDRLTDYGEIRRQFKNFIDSNFIETDTSDNSFYASDEYLTQFKSVRTLWDNGNLRLWSTLPSQTPRTVPEGLFQMKGSDLYSHQSIVRSELYSGKVSIFKRFGISVIVFFILFLFIGFGLRPLYYGKIDFWVVISVPLLVFVIALWRCWYGVKWKSKIKLPEHRDADIQVYNNRNLLLTDGIKTIATVVSVQYKPNNGMPGEDYQYEGMPDSEGDCVYIHNIPSFVVTYKFNPPDDSLGEDLIHQITIHRAPDGHLNPGDPLPILYSIDPKDKRKVCSMPFPFAMCDTENYGEIVCYTEHGKPLNPEVLLALGDHTGSHLRGGCIFGRPHGGRPYR